MLGRRRGVRGWIDARRFDVVGAALGLLLAMLLFPLRFLSTQIYIQTLPIVLGLACLLYLLAVRQNRSAQGLPQFSAWFARLAPTLVFLGLAGMVLIATLADERSVPFYDLGGVVGTLLLAQIVFLRDRDLHPGLLLAQVIALGFVVRFAALYTAPGFIGVDVWSHTTYAEAIAEQGSLSAIAGNKYYASPFYHLLTVGAAELYGLSLRNGLYLSLGIVMPLSVLFVYEAASLLVPVRWATFGAALYVISDHAIRWGIHIIPTSMGLVFFLAMFLILMRFLQTEHSVRDIFLLVFFSAAVILTHQISSFIMLVLLGTGLLGQFLFQFDIVHDPHDRSPFGREAASPVSLLGVLIFDIGLITFMWSLTPYQGDTFLETVLSYLYQTLITSAGFLQGVSGDGAGAAGGGAGGSAGSQLLAEVVTYIDTLGFLLLLFATVVGSLVVLRRRRASYATFTLLFAVIVMLFFVLGLPLFNINNFVPGRWVAFLYAPMVVLTGIGLGYLSRNVSPKVAVTVVVVFMLVFPSVMLMSTDGSMDSPVFPSQHERLSYTETELAAVETLGAITDENVEPIHTDHPYATVFERTEAHPAHVIPMQNGRAMHNGPTLYRNYQSNGGSFFRTQGGTGAGIRNPSRAEICPGSMNHVYANGDARLCMSPTTGG